MITEPSFFSAAKALLFAEMDLVPFFIATGVGVGVAAGIGVGVAVGSGVGVEVTVVCGVGVGVATVVTTSGVDSSCGVFGGIFTGTFIPLFFEFLESFSKTRKPSFLHPIWNKRRETTRPEIKIFLFMLPNITALENTATVFILTDKFDPVIFAV